MIGFEVFLVLRFCILGFGFYLPSQSFANETIAISGLSREACIKMVSTNCSYNGVNLKDLLTVVCEARRTTNLCDQQMKVASAEERRNFDYCFGAATLCDAIAPDRLASVYSCGEGAGGVLIDAAFGIVLLPFSALSLVIQSPELLAKSRDVFRKCFEDQDAKLAYLGALRPKDMTDTVIKNMSCTDVQAFVKTKVEVILSKLEEKRQQEMINRNQYEISVYDLSLTDQEIQALNFDLGQAGKLRRALCYPPKVAAKILCQELTKTALAAAGGMGAVKLIKSFERQSRLAVFDPTLTEVENANSIDGIGRILGQEIPFRKIPTNKGYTSVESLGGETKNDAFFGLSPGGHGYLVTRGQRFDGGISGLVMSKARNTQLLSDGIVIRIKNLPEESLNRMEAYLKERKFPRFSVTCVSATCRVLQTQGDVKLEGVPVGKFSPSVILRQIARNGVVDKNGNKLPVEFYVLGDDTFNSVRRETVQVEGIIALSVYLKLLQSSGPAAPSH